MNNYSNQPQNILWLFAGESAIKHALPRLLNLQKEQQLDTFRASAKRPPEVYQPSDERRGSSADEMGRLKSEQIPLKRKDFSFAGFPVLAGQRFSSLKTGKNSRFTKENHEAVNRSQKQIRRKDTSYLTSVSENNNETGRERNLNSLKIVSEDHNDWLISSPSHLENNLATIV